MTVGRGTVQGATRWIGCTTCGVLRDHVRATVQLTPFDAGQAAETWTCTFCGTSRLRAKPCSDQDDREQLERRGQLRLID